MEFFSDYKPLLAKLNLDSNLNPTRISSSNSSSNSTPIATQLPFGRNARVTNCLSSDCTISFRFSPNDVWNPSIITILAHRTINIDLAANTQYQLVAIDGSVQSAIYTAPAVNLLPNQISFRADVSSVGPCELHIIATTVYNGFNQALTLYTRYDVQQPWYEAGVTVASLTTHQIIIPLGFQLCLSSARPNADIRINDDNIISSSIYTLVPGYNGSTIYFLSDGSVRFGITYDNSAPASTTSWWAKWWWVVVLISLLVLLIVGTIIWSINKNAPLRNDF